LFLLRNFMVDVTANVTPNQINLNSTA